MTKGYLLSSMNCSQVMRKIGKGIEQINSHQNYNWLIDKSIKIIFILTSRSQITNLIYNNIPSSTYQNVDYF